MLKNYNRNIFSIFIVACITLVSCSNSSVKLNSKDHDIVNSYLEEYKKFRDFSCRALDESTHQELLKAFRGTGYYVPELNNNILDQASIEAIIPTLIEKKDWIAENINLLTKLKKLPNLKKINGEIIERINSLLNLKEKFYYEVDGTKKKFLLGEGSKQRQKLQMLLDEYLKAVPFLLSFKFPVDHLFNRNKYDQLKQVGPKDKKQKSKIHSNYVYLMRKVLEDGAFDPDNSRPDLMLRAAIDTIYINFENEKEILSENLRFDLLYMLDSVDKQLARGKDILISRMKEWEKRTLNTIEFYSNLLANSTDEKKSNSEEIILKKLSEDRFKLMDFVLNKQSEVYAYWSKKSELLKSIFVYETILLNEVGTVDGTEGLERRDVAKIVYNRYHDPHLQHLPKRNQLYSYLLKIMSEEQIQKEWWLNILFKEGEFSFTYYFISSSNKIFCPDNSRNAQFLRKENIKIALDTLRSPDLENKASRYFSRQSMVGRIDMTSVWNDYEKLPERPGKPLIETTFLIKKIKSKNYQYLYSFKDENQNDFDVLDVSNQTIVVSHQSFASNNFEIYSYRNPHNFIYFKKH